MMISTACAALIAAGSGLHPWYGDRLSNHLPMALVALDRIGASTDQLQKFAAHYSSRLQPRGAAMAAIEPLPAFGVRSSFEGVYRYFVEQIAATDVHRVLRTWVPQLMPGVSASAFHALIRLAYAVEAALPSEIACGLAYWVADYQPLGDLGGTSDQTLYQIALSTTAAVRGHRFKPGIIVDRMAEISLHPALRRACTQPRSIDYGDIAQFAIARYAAREDFTVLHTVTACHAFAILAPYAGDATHACRYLWQAILLALLTTEGVPEAEQTMPQQTDRSWQQCLQRAAASLDDHVIKLVYTAWQMSELRVDARYLQVAWRKAFADS